MQTKRRSRSCRAWAILASSLLLCLQKKPGKQRCFRFHKCLYTSKLDGVTKFFLHYYRYDIFIRHFWILCILWPSLRQGKRHINGERWCEIYWLRKENMGKSFTLNCKHTLESRWFYFAVFGCDNENDVKEYFYIR